VVLALRVDYDNADACGWLPTRCGPNADSPLVFLLAVRAVGISGPIPVWPWRDLPTDSPVYVTVLVVDSACDSRDSISNFDGLSHIFETTCSLKFI
jgi:hypothetical protein